MAATTGLRRGELLGLTWADVADGRLTIRCAMSRIRGNGWGLGEVKSARSRRTISLEAEKERVARAARLERRR